MRIFVCVKQVPEVRAIKNISKTTIRQDGNEGFHTINLPDRSALEQALWFKRHLTDVEVVAVSFGPSRVREILDICLKMGADRAIHLEGEDSDLDVYAVGQELAKLIRESSFDLVLCGSGSADWNGSQVASVLASILDVPQISGVIELQVSQSEAIARATRRLRRGARQVVECSLPVVIAVEGLIQQPRYISVHTRLKQKFPGNTLIERVGVDGLEMGKKSLIELVDIAPRRPRPKKVIMPEENLSSTERLKLMISGGVSSKKNTSSVVKGNVADVSRRVMNYLVEENLLD